jgi:hypothetical protein
VRESDGEADASQSSGPTDHALRVGLNPTVEIDVWQVHHHQLRFL